MMSGNGAVDRRLFEGAIIKSVGRIIKKYHTAVIIKIALEEILRHLLLEKVLVINNFGAFKVIKSNSKKYMDVVSGKIQSSRQNNKLKIVLDKNLAKYILNNIDTDKTFNGEI
jgi:nucleoid DNA-binding protein